MRDVRGSPPGYPAALAPLSAYGGNLIVTLDFFRWGAKYYKVTEKVDASGSAPPTSSGSLPHPTRADEDVRAQPEILHDLRIVHSDLKPSNVLVKRTELGYTTKLIDFDSAYLAGRPPRQRRSSARSTITPLSCSGTSKRPGSSRASSASRPICSPSAHLHRYLTGTPPPFEWRRITNRRSRSGAVRRSGSPGRYRARARRPRRPHAGRRPAHRPTIGEVHAILMAIRPPQTWRAPRADRLQRHSAARVCGPHSDPRPTVRRVEPVSSGSCCTSSPIDRPRDRGLALPRVRGRQSGRSNVHDVWHDRCAGRAHPRSGAVPAPQRHHAGAAPRTAHPPPARAR